MPCDVSCVRAYLRHTLSAVCIWCDTLGLWPIFRRFDYFVAIFDGTRHHRPISMVNNCAWDLCRCRVNDSLEANRCDRSINYNQSARPIQRQKSASKIAAYKTTTYCIISNVSVGLLFLFLLLFASWTHCLCCTYLALTLLYFQSDSASNCDVAVLNTVAVCLLLLQQYNVAAAILSNADH